MSAPGLGSLAFHSMLAQTTEVDFGLSQGKVDSDERNEVETVVLMNMICSINYSGLFGDSANEKSDLIKYFRWIVLGLTMIFLTLVPN